MSVRFEDNSIHVKAEIKQAIIAALHECAGEIVSQTQRNSRVGKISGGQTKGAWKYVVDENKLSATMGNPLENAIWEEFGTGEYALEGKGRKGGWYIPIGSGKNCISEATVEAYHMKVVTGTGGKRYAYTEGKKPNRAFYEAYNKLRSKIENRLAKELKGMK